MGVVCKVWVFSFVILFTLQIQKIVDFLLLKCLGENIGIVLRVQMGWKISPLDDKSCLDGPPHSAKILLMNDYKK